MEKVGALFGVMTLILFIFWAFTMTWATFLVFAGSGAIFLIIYLNATGGSGLSENRRAASTPAPATAPPPSSSSTSGDSGLFGLLFTIAIGVLAFKGLQKTYSFLSELNWDSLDPAAQQAISRFEVDVEKIRDHGERLDRAESLLSNGDKISLDVAAMLTSATLESGLKHLQEQENVVLSDEEKEGMVGIAIALRNHGTISPVELTGIRRFGGAVRNKVMHGEFDAVEEPDVEEGIRLTREFFSAHNLM